MKQNLPFLKHILDEIIFLLSETKRLTYEDFISNELLKRGCARSIEVIGEAVKNISNDLKNKHKEIEWRKMAGMRDKIIHYYFGVNWDIVWDVIQKIIPELKPKIETIINKLERNKREK
ncbi:hypothetical protein AUJ66_05095 [Candidatus Desantisbacteria bacterium CG1_02_38_46]|uniref:DUF86 domain-containing protein n=3 Tax=unclassified Candidatus Desantisiibacteriota TaxID=3106372 RepID=A0A2H9PAF2_9BACT|nr:MAG: hypothetical protein AUJ66_05095 [Candidatus Desantisbacteria bacterium CG1_02_38_46]PIU51376.1 MAG: hypothetical protein COS91_04700 [Candidatus Desantisbacteria bacterium CG07_land_8_20_14_0_80_39_15]PIZ15415.1 MAG: hypothetical protein COY51_05300 [Candidatus Desantisbacteria bacterium CG_4_10_14_0_8_um_filter_39_17]